MLLLSLAVLAAIAVTGIVALSAPPAADDTPLAAGEESGPQSLVDEPAVVVTEVAIREAGSGRLDVSWRADDTRDGDRFQIRDQNDEVLATTTDLRVSIPAAGAGTCLYVNSVRDGQIGPAAKGCRG